MKKDMYDIIKPESEKKEKPVKKVIIKKDKTVKKMEKLQKKEEKKAKVIIGVKKENPIKVWFNSISKDALVVFGIVIAMVVICLAVVFYYFANVTNAKVATYKGGNVSRQEYELQYKLMASEMQYQGKKEAEIRKDIVDNIVINKLLLEKANKDKMVLSDDSKKLVTDFSKDTESIKSYTARGVTEKDLLKLYDKIKAAIISKDGKDADMNKYMTRHILFAFTDSTTGEAKDKTAQKAKAEEILAKVKNGGDFADLAKANSEDTGTKADGGKFDAIADKDMVAPEYVNAMTTLKPGQIYATLVESTYGYHIIKLDSIEEGGRLKDTNVQNSYSYLMAMQYLREANVKLNDKVLAKVEKDLLKIIGVGNANK
jgi:parvulin-like peptidyl-prolyl isomerase